MIAPSRFGYLRSPVPGERSPAAQADAYAALLDTLQIQQVAILGFSDGGPSALQFALRHPERCAALIMMAAKSATPPPTTLVQEMIFNSIFRSDYVYWSITEYTKPFLLSTYGVPAEVQNKCSAAELESVYTFLESMHPMSLRKVGIDNDRATLGRLPVKAFPLEQIKAPLLIVHAKDDALQHFAYAQFLLAHHPTARRIAFETGGHLLLGHQEEAHQAVLAFLNEHAPARSKQVATLQAVATPTL